MVKIAVVGDIHGRFNIKDVSYFNESDYDLILAVGDLVDWKLEEALNIASLLASIQKPLLFIPGNHDGIHPLQLLAELKRIWFGILLASMGHSRRLARLRERLGPVAWCGYSTHPFVVNDLSFDIVAGRPFSMGGPRLSFLPILRQEFGLSSMDDSALRLKQCVDASNSDRLIFLAHNGPSGLGNSREDIWGCDFLPEEGDYGDPDLAQAIAYARKNDKEITAVLAGHMHLRLQGGGQRDWKVERDGTVYINAARVPRIFQRGDRTVHHHIRLELTNNGTEAIQVLVSE